MKKLLVFAFLSLSVSIISATEMHPIKLTSSLLKYDAKAKSISVQCKVFFDDFSPAINEELFDSINALFISDSDLREIEAYFMDHYKITINGVMLPWKVESYNIAKSENVLTLEFVHRNVSLAKGDKLLIENTMLFELFGDIQSNWMTLRFPPFLKNEYYECNTFNQKYSHTL